MTETVSFRDLALSEPVQQALDDVGYETPSPIQARIIPHVLAGRDVLGQAQTGTGKTAAFACPLLSRIDLSVLKPQVLVLAPTRELAIQVAEAFQRYAKHMKGFHVLPVYGGQDYGTQLRPLKRGVHVVVGTPGRVMDHMRKGTLKLEALNALVLDEADEMLRMGFIDDVKWVLEQTPDNTQIALFSATMPSVIKRIASQHLNDPVEVSIKVKTTTAETIRQRVWMVSGLHKLDALTRILEAEEFDGIIIFVRTRTLTVELAEKLQARGYNATALNGDIVQKQRERTIQQLKSGGLDILVATDVAARGLDVERISHVINYDIPHDTEAYVHRIGRTGRAGRKGDAILFVAPRERRLLGNIERVTRQKIEMMELPSTELINNQRIAKFKQGITDTLAAEGLGFFSSLVEQYQQEHNVPAQEIAAALAKMVQGDTPMLLDNRPIKASQRLREKRNENRPHPEGSRRERQTAGRGNRTERQTDRASSNRKKPASPEQGVEQGMERYRVEVGHNDNVQPGNIVGAIANEAGLDSQHIGRIVIYDDFSTIDLPEGMPKDIYKDLKKAWVAGKKMEISMISERKVLRKPNRDEVPARGVKKPKKSAGKKSASKKPRKPKTFKKPEA